MPRPRVAVLLVALALAPAAAAFAAAAPAPAGDAGYRTPPSVVADILTAPRLPRGAPSASPDGARVIVPELPSLVPIAALAEPVEKLAGLEILPALHANRVAIKLAPTGFSIVPLAGGPGIRAQLPAGSRVIASEWSNDGTRIACATLAPGGADLWVVEAASGAARRLDGVRLNTVLGAAIEWTLDDRELICAAVPEMQPALAPPDRVPVGPQVRIGAGRATPQRTSRDVLRTADDQSRFAWHLTAQLTRVPAAGGTPRPIGGPALLRRWSMAPDERHLLIERFVAPLPLGFPYPLFPTTIEILNADGTLAAKVGDVPLDDRSAISSVAPLGPRRTSWAPDGQALYFFSWQDTPGADPMKAVRDTSLAQPGTDRLMRLAAPFTASAQVVATSEFRLDELEWIGDGGRLLLHDGYEPRRLERRWWIDVAHPEQRTVLSHRSTEGVYDDPGSPLGRPLRHQDVLWTTAGGKAIYLAGAGFRKDGQRPFLDRVDLASGKATRLYESDAAHLEPVLGLLGADARRFITSRESNREPRNYWVRRAGDRSGTRLTDFRDPAPALTAAQRVQFTFTRPDSVRLNAEAVLPPDWKPGTALPTIFWIYPNDYRSAAAASQNRRSPNRFPSQSALNPEVLVTQGYAVVYPDIAVVGTNDRYVDEIKLSAKAAVDECVRRGFTDRDRIGVGGHSYGAFSTANVLAHTDLFRAGIASDGAYNRTLTPFTFQAEERTLWQARDTYLQMSPFLYADRIRQPLLLLHNLDDTNVGTNPIQSERMYEALNGLGRTVTLVQYPYEDHGPAARETVLDYWSRAIEWFDRYVKSARGAEAASQGGESAK
jgi:dipeptidyl aminopeptidase/acylaminoacyl peptidase